MTRNPYQKVNEKGKVSLVGDLEKSFVEEGFVPLGLGGRVLALYDTNGGGTILNAGLSREEINAANYLGEAYKALYQFHTERREYTSITEVKYYAATMAIPLERIKRKIRDKKLFDITIRELAYKFKVPLELAQYRRETLSLEDPDIHTNLEKKYDPYAYLDDDEDTALDIEDSIEKIDDEDLN